MDADKNLSPTWILEDDISALIRRLAQKLCRSRGFTASAQEDVEQDFRLLLLRKAALFDANRAKPITFAERIIKNYAISLARAARSQKRGRGRAESIFDTVEVEHGRIEELVHSLDESAGRRHTGQRQRDFHEAKSLKLDVEAANESLSKPLRDVAALMSHVSQFATAKVLGISRRQLAIHVEVLRDIYEKRGLSA
jgi:RNA polymerase sigma factor (sigma-70 family)